VVLHAAHEVAEAAPLLVNAFAAEGWLAVAPHLRAHSGESVLADTDIAFGFLGERGVTPDLMGVVGFDLGGTAAMVVAASRQVGAAVSIAAGGIIQPAADALPPVVEIAGGLKGPWLGVYGDQDAEIDPSEVEKLRDAAIGSGVATNVVRFAEAGHRFDTDPDAAHEAWNRTLNWFDAHLR